MNENKGKKTPLIPNNWKWITFEEAGSGDKNAIVDGPFGSNLKLTDYITGIEGVPVLTTKNLEHGYSIENLRFISFEKFSELRRSEVRSGDVLIAKIGSVGKHAIYPDGLPSAIIPANLMKITVNKEIDTNYLNYFLDTKIFKDQLSSITSATAQPAFGITKFKQLLFPLAPKQEQLKIVSKIDELFSQLDAAEAALKRARANLKRYRQSVLQAAVTGELTREWRESHQGEIDELHFDTNKNSMYLEKIVNPYGWGVFKFEELITKSQNGLSKRNSELGDDVIVLRLADITSDMVNTEKKRYIKCSKQEIDNYELHKDDLLCIRVNGSRDLVGRVIRISELPETMLFCDHFIRFKLKNDNMAKYLSLYLNSDLIRKYIEKNMVSSAGQNTVSQGTYFNIMVTLPSIQEQYKILEYIEQAFSIISNLDKTIEINLKKISHTRQSILSQAFTGNLIPRELEL